MDLLHTLLLAHACTVLQYSNTSVESNIIYAQVQVTLHIIIDKRWLTCMDVYVLGYFLVWSHTGMDISADSH